MIVCLFDPRGWTATHNKQLINYPIIID